MAGRTRKHVPINTHLASSAGTSTPTATTANCGALSRISPPGHTLKATAARTHLSLVPTGERVVGESYFSGAYTASWYRIRLIVVPALLYSAAVLIVHALNSTATVALQR